MKINFSTLSLAAYIFPALSSYWVIGMLGERLNEFAVYVICGTALISWLAYWISSFFLKTGIVINMPHYYRFYRVISGSFMVVGLFAMSLNFISVRTIPLFGGDVERVLMQESILWNVYILCSVGVFLSSYINEKRVFSFNNILIISYLFSALLSGWKGTLLNIIVLYLVPRYKNSAVGLKVFIKGVLFLIVLLLGVNMLRSGGDDLSVDFIAPLFYLYWGFVNFSDIAGGVVSDCLYSNPFDFCKFSFENDLLAISTWNVYTALMPLYIDGGLLYSLAFFFAVAFVLYFSSRFYGSIAVDYVFFMCANFLLIAHNGYLFSSKSIWVSLGVLCLVDIIRFSQIKPYSPIFMWDRSLVSK